nr:MAG TPA: hypothetical protein [Caudoviricetes sp.]
MITIILILAYLLVLPQSIEMTVNMRKNDTTGLDLKNRLPWFMHFISVWLIMPFFMIKYYLIDKK